MSTDLAWNLIAITAMGMAVAALSADYRSSSTRMLALMLTMTGVSLVLEANFLAGIHDKTLPVWANWATVPGSLAIIFLAEWLRLIRRTAQQPADDLHSDNAIRNAQIAALVFALMSFLFPEWRADYLLLIVDQPGVLLEPRFYALAIPLFLALGLILVAVSRTLLLQPDPPERIRLLGVAFSMPIILMAFIVPASVAPYCAMLGEMALLVGIMQYHVQWGQRGQFMSRFLSPQVAAAVRERGLDGAVHEDRVELTAVACDIRGFSNYAEAQDSNQVIALLNRYYQIVGEVAAEHGATIKDYAGDGVLILLGAPLADPHHADHAIALAIALRERCQPLWKQTDLGLGIGIASGQVSVGIVGTQPMEYAAVGRAINLASRLCDHARDGEILLNERCCELIDVHEDQLQLHSSQRIQFKGLAEPVPVWKITPDRDTVQRLKQKRDQQGSWLSRLFR